MAGVAPWLHDATSFPALGDVPARPSPASSSSPAAGGAWSTRRPAATRQPAAATVPVRGAEGESAERDYRGIRGDAQARGQGDPTTHGNGRGGGEAQVHGKPQPRGEGRPQLQQAETQARGGGGAQGQLERKGGDGGRGRGLPHARPAEGHARGGTLRGRGGRGQAGGGSGGRNRGQDGGRGRGQARQGEGRGRGAGRRHHEGRDDNQESGGSRASAGRGHGQRHMRAEAGFSSAAARERQGGTMQGQGRSVPGSVAAITATQQTAAVSNTPNRIPPRPLAGLSRPYSQAHKAPVVSPRIATGASTSGPASTSTRATAAASIAAAASPVALPAPTPAEAVAASAQRLRLPPRKGRSKPVPLAFFGSGPRVHLPAPRAAPVAKLSYGRDAAGGRKTAPVNPLDSSAPIRRRGKERLKPRRKVSHVRRALQLERSLKLQLRQAFAAGAAVAEVGTEAETEEISGSESEAEQATAEDGPAIAAAALASTEAPFQTMAPAADEAVAGDMSTAAPATAAVEVAPTSTVTAAQPAASGVPLADGGNAEAAPSTVVGSPPAEKVNAATVIANAVVPSPRGEAVDAIVTTVTTDAVFPSPPPASDAPSTEHVDAAAPPSTAAELSTTATAANAEPASTAVDYPPAASTVPSREAAAAAAAAAGLQPRRRFREYCSHAASKELDKLAQTLLRELNRFQLAALQRNAVKAQARKRFVLGFNEVSKKLLSGKIKLVVVAPDIQRSDVDNGPDDLLLKMLNRAPTELPVFYSLNRNKLGRALNRSGPVAVVGILNYDGAESIVAEMRALRDSLAAQLRERRAAIGSA